MEDLQIFLPLTKLVAFRMLPIALESQLMSWGVERMELQAPTRIGTM